MSQPPRDPVRYVEITRAERVRRLGQLFAPLAVLPLAMAALGSALLPPPLRALAAVLAFSLATVVVCLVLLAPPLLALLARSRLRAPLALRHAEGELQLVDPAGRPRWQVPLPDVGVAWQREARMVEVVTASGDEAQLGFATTEAAAEAVDFIRHHARDRRTYSLALESDTVRLWRISLAWALPSSVALVLVTALPSLWPVAPLAVALGALGARGTRRVSLGADGVLVEGRFRRRHVPYRDIAAIEYQVSTFGWCSIALRHADGRRVRVVSRLSPDRAALTRALLEEGCRMVERGEAAGTAGGMLTGRGASEWLETLRGTSRRADYRRAALDADRLVSIVRNPAAAAAQRVAAALALRSEPSGAARIRVAAEVSTEPAVREALEALGADDVDEQRVERVLRRLSLAGP